MRLMLVNNRRLNSTVEMGERLAVALHHLGAEVLIDSGGAEIAPQPCDAIIVLGGDGTMIRAARQYADREVPVLGVNMGTVGFLSNIRADELEQYLDRFLSGDFSLEERMLQEISLTQGDTAICKLLSLNEVSIKSKGARLITLDVKVEGHRHGVYRGDGLIVATPSGSTAYSLSCGGPIVDPGLDAFVLTPITSYLLNKRPLVIAAEKQIDVYPLDGEEYYVAVDGQMSREISADCSVRIIKSGYRLKLAIMKPRYFFETIMERLQRDH